MKEFTRLRRNYISLHNNYSWNNEFAGEIMFHVLIGQLLRDSRLYIGPINTDLRINFLWAQTSGTGKSSAAMLLSEVGKAVGLKVEKPIENNDAAYIGSVIADKYRKRGKLHVDVKELDGYLKKSDLLIIHEGTDLIMGTSKQKWAVNTRNYIKQALDPIGRNEIERPMKHAVLKYTPHLSVVVLGHYVPGRSVIEKTGFFQRFLIYPRELSMKERLENTKKELYMMSSGRKSQRRKIQELEKKKEDLIDDLIDLDKGPFDIYIPKGVAGRIFSSSQRMILYIDNLPPDVKQFMSEFVDRYRRYLGIIAAHRAVINGRFTIGVDDVSYAEKIVAKSFWEAVSWFESGLPRKSVYASYDSLKKLLTKLLASYNAAVGDGKDKNPVGLGFIAKKDLISYASRMWNVSRNTVDKRWLNRTKQAWQVQKYKTMRYLKPKESKFREYGVVIK